MEGNQLWSCATSRHEEKWERRGKTARNADQGATKRLVTGMFLCNYQVNFTQTFEKSQKVKCELCTLPSAEVEIHENKPVRQKIEDRNREKTISWDQNRSLYLTKSGCKQLLCVSICVCSFRWNHPALAAVLGFLTLAVPVAASRLLLFEASVVLLRLIW